MIDFLLNKKTIGAFVAGIVACFTLISTLIMNPGDMRRWILNDSTNEEKVESALFPKSVRILKLKDEVAILKDDLVEKVEEFNSANKIYRDENKKLRRTIEDLRVSLNSSNTKFKSLEDRLGSQLSQNEMLKNEIELIRAQNKELSERMERGGIEKGIDYSLILKEQEFLEDVPKIYFSGKLSITAERTYPTKTYLRIIQFFPDKSTVGFWLFKGKPELIEIANVKYIIYLLVGSSSSKSIISTFYAPTKSNKANSADIKNRAAD
jgi:hypothetical protein